MTLNPNDRPWLRRFLVERFSLDELYDLAFDIGVDFQQFSNNRKPTFCREMIDYLQRRNELGCLIREILRYYDDNRLVQLLSELGPCEPRQKILIILPKNKLVSVSEDMDKLAEVFQTDKKDIVLVAVASGSMRLLLALPYGTIDFQALLENRYLGNKEYPIISVVLFKALSSISQFVWRMIAYYSPPVIEANLLYPTVSWETTLEIARGAETETGHRPNAVAVSGELEEAGGSPSYSSDYEETIQSPSTSVSGTEYFQRVEFHEGSRLHVPSRSDLSAQKKFRFARTCVTILDEFSDLLSPSPSPRIITLHDFLRRYRLSGIGQPAMDALFQSRQILLRTKNHHDIGVGLFHSGLFLFYWAEFFGAQQYFSAARRSWSRENDSAWICLTYCAQGLAQQGIHMYADAMVSFGKAEHWLQRIDFSLPSNNQDKFIRQMTSYLQEWQARLRDDMLLDFKIEDPTRVAAEEKATGSVPEEVTVTPTAPVPPPYSVLNADANQPDSTVPTHMEIDDSYVWYQVSTEDENFLPDVVQGSWLLVNTDTAHHNFKQDELIVVLRNENTEGSIVLRAHTPGQPFQRITFLGSSRFEGTFTRVRETGKVALSPGTEQHVNMQDILGIVIGLWPALPRPDREGEA